MRKPTDLRQKVLDASLALIEEGGLDRLSMREVARKAGVSHQAPYHYFSDREAILAALAGEGFLTVETPRGLRYTRNGNLMVPHSVPYPSHWTGYDYTRLR